MFGRLVSRHGSTRVSVLRSPAMGAGGRRATALAIGALYPSVALLPRAYKAPGFGTAIRFYSTDNLPPTPSSALPKLVVAKLRQLLVRDTRKVSPGETISAVLSGLVMGNLLWIILGTTTFGLALMSGLYYFDGLISDEDDPKPLMLRQMASQVMSVGLGVNVQLGKSLPLYKDGKLRLLDFKLVSDATVDGQPALSGRVEHMDITLLFGKWSEGRGLIQAMEIFGLNGKLYRNYDQSLVDASYVFDLVKVHDLVCRVYSSIDDPSPLKISVFSADMVNVHGDRLLMDFFGANNVLGAINNSMFTIHKRQTPDGAADSKLIRFKLDGINLGLLARADPQSKFNWMVNGRAEISADITFPPLDDAATASLPLVFDLMINHIGGHTSDDDTTTTTDTQHPLTLLKGALTALYHTFSKPVPETLAMVPYVVVNVTVKFHDIKASVPKYLPLAALGAPFVLLQNLRALILCVNGEGGTPPNPIVVKTTAILKVDDLYNVLDLTHTPMWDAIVGDVYDELLKLVKVKEQRILSQRSLMWSHSLALQLVLLGLGVMV